MRSHVAYRPQEGKPACKVHPGMNRPRVQRHQRVVGSKAVRMRAALEDERPRPGRRPPIPGLPEIGTIARKSATADLRWLPRIESGVASASEPAPDLIRT